MTDLSLCLLYCHTKRFLLRSSHEQSLTWGYATCISQGFKWHFFKNYPIRRASIPRRTHIASPSLHKDLISLNSYGHPCVSVAPIVETYQEYLTWKKRVISERPDSYIICGFFFSFHNVALSLSNFTASFPFIWKEFYRLLAHRAKELSIQDGIFSFLATDFVNEVFRWMALELAKTRKFLSS